MTDFRVIFPRFRRLGWGILAAWLSLTVSTLTTPLWSNPAAASCPALPSCSRGALQDPEPPLPTQPSSGQSSSVQPGSGQPSSGQSSSGQSIPVDPATAREQDEPVPTNPAPTPLPGVIEASAASGNATQADSPPLSLNATSVVSETPVASIDDRLGLPGWLVEQSIYIPYDHIKDQFERDGRGVFIPYEQFNELWQRAQKNQPPVEAVQVPVANVVVMATNRAKLERSLVRVESQVSIEFLQTGWHRVPLGLAGCAIQSADLDGAACRLIQTADGSFELVHEVDEVGRIELDLQYVVNVTLTGSENRVTWTVPAAAINRWEVSIDQPDVDITVLPAVVISTGTQELAVSPAATSDENSANAAPTEDTAVAAMDAAKTEQSTITALLGNSKTIDLRWTPRSLGAEGLEALLALQTELAAEVQANLVRLRHELAINVQRAAIDAVDLAVPPGVRIVNVLSDGVKRWQVTNDPPLLRVELFEQRQGDLRLSIETEQDLVGSSSEPRKLTLQPIQLPNATRQPGKVTIASDKDLRIEVLGATGLSRVNEEAAAPALDPAAPLRFAYSSVPYQLDLQVVEWEPAIAAQQRISAQMQSRQIETETRFLFDVRQRGIFQIPLQVKTDLEIVAVRGLADGAHQAVRVEKFSRSAEQLDRVVVQLAAEARGPIGLVVLTTQKLPDPGLVDANAAPLPVTLDWPRVPAEFVESFQGQLVLSAPESLELSVDSATTNQFRNQAVDVAPRSGTGVQQFTYDFPEGVTTFGLLASVRRPQVFVDQLSTVAIESGLWRYTVDLDYDVRFSPVQDLRVDIPQDRANRIRVTSGNLTARAIQPQPNDVAEGLVAWQLSGAKPLLGRGTVQLGWDETVPEIGVGQRATRPFDTVSVRQVDRARGQILVKRSELFDVQIGEETEGLRAIDPSTEMFSGRKQDDVAAALEYVGPWKLSLQVSRYELYDLKRSSVPRSLIRAVWLRNQQLSVQAIYRVNSVNQRLSIQMPPGFDPVQGFDSTPVRLDGQSVAIERGQGNSIVIPLGNRDRDRQWLLELRYTMPVSAASMLGGGIPVPTFDDGCAVQKTQMIVYLPHDWAPLNFGGPWSDEAAGSGSSVWTRVTRSPGDETERLEWIVTPAVSVAALSDFETDGIPFQFSSLAPPAGEAGALQITIVNIWLYRGLAVGVVLLLGLALLRSTWSLRLAAVAAGFGLWLTAGVLWPFAIKQLDYNSLGATVFLVVGMWAVSTLLATMMDIRSWFKHRGAGRSGPSPSGASDAHVAPAESTVNEERRDGQ